MDKVKKIDVRDLLVADCGHHRRDTPCGPSEAEAEAPRCWSEVWQKEEECPRDVESFNGKEDEADADTSLQAFVTSGDESAQHAQNLDGIEIGESSAPDGDSSRPGPSCSSHKNFDSHKSYNVETENYQGCTTCSYSTPVSNGVPGSLYVQIPRMKDIGEVFPKEQLPSSHVALKNDLNTKSSAQRPTSETKTSLEQSILKESKLLRTSKGECGSATRPRVTSRSRARLPPAQRNNTPIFGAHLVGFFHYEKKLESLLTSIKHIRAEDLTIHLCSRFPGEKGLIYAPVNTTEARFSLVRVDQ